MSVDRFERACALLLAVALGMGEAHAQSSASGDASSGPSSQIWLNLTPGTNVGQRWYLELDVEPKLQVTEGEQWRNLDVTPLVEFYPTDWVDLEAEATVGSTHQRDGGNTFEVTPRVGARLHLFSKMAPYRPGLPGLRYERLPLTRLGISTLLRLESRNFFFSDGTVNSHQWRARVRLESKVALNRPKLSDDRTLYAMADAEYFAPLEDDVPERYVNKIRVRLGLGYRFPAATKLELLYIRDSNRSSPHAEAAVDAQAFNLRVKLLF